MDLALDSRFAAAKNWAPWASTAIPAALLATALGFQYLGGLEPCQLCIWQRWPHVAAVLFGAGYCLTGGRMLAVGAVVALAAGSGIGFYHVGVEQSWWTGLASCTGSLEPGLSGTDLLDFSAPVQVASCNTIVWQFVGLSMAGWNTVLSFVLAATWLWIAIPSRNGNADGARSR